jgi:hypothetical protein
MNKDKYFTEITVKEALNLFEDGSEVFLLYSDNTEGLAESVESILEHSECGGGFGVE